MRAKFWIVTLVASLLSTYSVGAWAVTELAKINKTTVSLEDFNKRYKDNLKFFPFKAPTRKAVLDDLIKRELGIQEARRLNLDKDPEVIDRMNTVLYQALLDRKLSKEIEKIFVSDDEAKTYYEKNPEVRTSHIFAAVKPDSTVEEEKKAREKIQAVQTKYLSDGKMSFAEVAQRYSEGIAAPMGGDVDYQTRDKLDPAYYEAAVKLRSPGKTTGIIRSQFGFHIIKLTAMRPWEEVDRGMVKRMVFEEKRASIFDQYMTQLRSQAKVSINSAMLKD